MTYGSVMQLPTAPAGEHRAAMYLRRSRTEQDSVTRKVQQDSCAEFITRRGWAHDPATDIYSDFGKSAYRKGVKRPGFDRLLQRAQEGVYDHIVVYRLDRFSRDWKTWADALAHSDVSFAIHSATEGLSSAADRMAVQFLAAVAEQESRNISDRVTGVKASLLAQGKWPGGVRPFGFAVVPAPDGRGKVLEIDEAEHRLVLEAVDRVLRGESVRSIVIDWNNRGLKTSMGKAWWPSALYRLLRSPLLVGERQGRQPGEPERPYPPMVDNDTYNRLLAKMERRTTSRTRTEGALLSGLLVCGECGARMGGYSNASRWADCYRCPRKSEQGPATCPGVSISSKRLEQAIVDLAHLLMGSPAYMSRVLRRSDPTISPERDEWARLQRKLRELEASYFAGDFEDSTGPARYRSHRSKLLAEIRKLEKRIGEESTLDAPDGAPLREFLDQSSSSMAVEGRTLKEVVEEYWDRLSRSEQREVLRSLLHKVIVVKGRPQEKGVPRDKRFRLDRISVAPWEWDNGERLVPLPDAMREALFGQPEIVGEGDEDPEVPEGFTPEEWERYVQDAVHSRSFDPWADSLPE